MAKTYPFSAILGQEEMKRALMIAAVDPAIGGVLIFGDRGTGKSTAVRALAELLPPMLATAGCRYHCDPDANGSGCAECQERRQDEPLKSEIISVPVVDLPLGATEDRIVGALDLERALTQGVKSFEPGLLARANRGFLYIDEVNLLEDHIVDLLLDAAASGENVVEREGLSIRHPARFVLVGSGNPEEGELRPQLLDRFGLCVEAVTPEDVETRVEIVRRRDAFERDGSTFLAAWQSQTDELRRGIVAARERLHAVYVGDAILRQASQLCVRVGADGLRGELTIVRAARALAALQGNHAVVVEHVREVAPAALRHRLRRDPLDESASTVRIGRAIEENFRA
ncbi:magnesium chelatase ATPase subunit I [Hyphomicrobium zavarzinii]|uniref:magnesium chelatase ATPase subunit I n=1 Tax=Hyphomicrobium zavarzinii TaxID=48292 RepID=UPI000361037B|nr:magnesium chelatase ATPase subunit I [Hyphomicrobium zavarzinii]